MLSLVTAAAKKKAQLVNKDDENDNDVLEALPASPSVTSERRAVEVV